MHQPTRKTFRSVLYYVFVNGSESSGHGFFLKEREHSETHTKLKFQSLVRSFKTQIIAFYMDLSRCR